MAVQDGVRIQKVMSDMGVASRRKCEEYIEQGRVSVNGHKAVTGMKINPKKDIVTLDGEPVGLPDGKKYYLAMYKPRGYVTTMSDEMGRKTVADLITDIPTRVYPIGRLDKLSEGLLLLTNDGAFANLLMHPSHEVTKVYRTTVEGIVKEDQLISLAEGVVIDDRRTLPAQVKVITSEEGRTVLEIVIREGRNRQIRKMCEAVGLTVKRLRRTMIGPVKLAMLKPGEYRELTGAELAALRSMSVKNQRKDFQEKQERESGQRGRRPAASRPAGARPGGDRPGYAKSSGDKSGYAKSGGDKSGYAKSSGDKPGYSKSGGDRPGYAKLSGDKPGYAKSGGGKPIGGRTGAPRSGGQSPRPQKDRK